ncbi:MAG: hypothetical protein V4850_36850 [Myxococcota bacterium]
MLLLLALSTPAHACSHLLPAAFVIDPGSDDTVAPGPPGAAIAVRVNRGREPACVDGRRASPDSCDHSGTITLHFRAAVDDRSPAVETGHVQMGVGYRVRVVRGALPQPRYSAETTIASAFAFARNGTAVLSLFWIDGATDDQEAFAATLGVTAVDLAGNESTETLYEVAAPGSASKPCVPEAWWSWGW